MCPAPPEIPLKPACRPVFLRNTEFYTVPSASDNSGQSHFSTLLFIGSVLSAKGSGNLSVRENGCSLPQYVNLSAIWTLSGLNCNNVVLNI
jgi:hypothetical protein